MVCIGKSVTLKSLFPGTIVTVRVSGFQPEPGIRTITTWSPSARLTFIGVTFPVFTPSTITSASRTCTAHGWTHDEHKAHKVDR
jgi:hypothetical protein